jgi:hypothetical protein
MKILAFFGLLGLVGCGGVQWTDVSYKDPSGKTISYRHNASDVNDSRHFVYTEIIKPDGTHEITVKGADKSTPNVDAINAQNKGVSDTLKQVLDLLKELKGMAPVPVPLAPAPK